jgi:hypothetical protein
MGETAAVMVHREGKTLALAVWAGAMEVTARRRPSLARIRRSPIDVCLRLGSRAQETGNIAIPST